MTDVTEMELAEAVVDVLNDHIELTRSITEMSMADGVLMFTVQDGMSAIVVHLMGREHADVLLVDDPSMEARQRLAALYEEIGKAWKRLGVDSEAVREACWRLRTAPVGVA